MKTKEDLLKDFLEALKSDRQFFRNNDNIPYARGVAQGYTRSIEFIENLLKEDDDLS